MLNNCRKGTTVSLSEISVLIFIYASICKIVYKIMWERFWRVRLSLYVSSVLCGLTFFFVTVGFFAGLREFLSTQLPTTASNFSWCVCLLTKADFASEQNGAQKGDREAAIDAEIARVNNLPARSSYAIHRMKVLNKLRHLMSIKVSLSAFWTSDFH